MSDRRFHEDTVRHDEDVPFFPPQHSLHKPRHAAVKVRHLLAMVCRPHRVLQIHTAVTHTTVQGCARVLRYPVTTVVLWSPRVENISYWHRFFCIKDFSTNTWDLYYCCIYHPSRRTYRPMGYTYYILHTQSNDNKKGVNHSFHLFMIQ